MTDKFISPEQPPEGIERELLTVLMEECAEVQQRASKMLRFGVTEVQPGQDLNNAQRLSVEVGDLDCLVRKCIDAGLICQGTMEVASTRKEEKLNRFFQSAETV